jgi:hypothetical protein
MSVVAQRWTSRAPAARPEPGEASSVAACPMTTPPPSPGARSTRESRRRRREAGRTARPRLRPRRADPTSGAAALRPLAPGPPARFRSQAPVPARLGPASAHPPGFASPSTVVRSGRSVLPCRLSSTTIGRPSQVSASRSMWPHPWPSARRVLERVPGRARRCVTAASTRCAAPPTKASMEASTRSRSRRAASRCPRGLPARPPRTARRRVAACR